MFNAIIHNQKSNLILSDGLKNKEVSKATNIIFVMIKVKTNENTKYDLKIKFIFVNYDEIIKMIFTRTVKCYTDYTFNLPSVKYTKIKTLSIHYFDKLNRYDFNN